jgi:hypothetical protein
MNLFLFYFLNLQEHVYEIIIRLQCHSNSNKITHFKSKKSFFLIFGALIPWLTCFLLKFRMYYLNKLSDILRMNDQK